MAKMKYSDLKLGIIEAVFNKLGGIEGAQTFLRSNVEIVVKNHVIDLDRDPYTPSGWQVVEHIKSGKFEWSLDDLILHLEDRQKHGGIKCQDLYDSLRGKNIFNASMLDYLLKYPTLIPEDWKGTDILFWGTIYHDSDNELCVRSLEWDGGWRWYYYLLRHVLPYCKPALLCK